MSRPAHLIAAAVLVSISVALACPGRGARMGRIRSQPLRQERAKLIGFGPGGATTWGPIRPPHRQSICPANRRWLPQNMPGAGDSVAANNIYNLPPRTAA